ncbi:acyl-CoA carboxylase subunit epsilon [Streptosporangium album]|uniref:acyl-CoA carboxylase subunit epsilon n=1 Tax=Streptosporangium album TaxID=47479 RepID=UPI001619C7EE|nr:acyl-CoA carboxylase subunit epsilon [Streptosporangium album]
MDGPELRIVYGDPTEEELCALICVLRLTAAAREVDGHADSHAGAPPWRPHGYRSPRSWSTSSTLRRPQ